MVNFGLSETASMRHRKRKFGKAMKAARLILRNPYLLNNVLSEPDVWQEYVVREYGMEKGLPVINMNQLLGDQLHEVGPITFLDGGSLPTDLALLRGLASRFTDCRYFEIGTWRGESVANLAGVAKECYTLNLSAKELKAMGVRSKYIYLLGYFSRTLDNVVHLEGNSMTFDFGGLNKKFDLVFIDGDHHYEKVKNDTRKAFQHLAHEKSIVVWHDYGYHPEKVRFEVLAGILDGVQPSMIKDLYHVSQTKCALFINQEIKGRFLDPPEEPDEYYELKMKSRKMGPDSPRAQS
jgi:predicted O-methyltransferase YrrM